MSTAKSKFEQSIGDAGTVPQDDGLPEYDTLAPSGVAVWSDTINVENDGGSAPFLSLVQPNSKLVTDEVAKAGQWYTQGFDAESAVIIVPMKFGLSRRFSIETDAGFQTACFSPTGVEHGTALMNEGPGIPCHDCELSKWTDTGELSANGRPKQRPPVCKESYDFLCFSVTHEMFVRIGFKSTGIKTGKLIAQLARTKGLGNFAVTLGSERVTGGKFNYVVPTARIMSADNARSAIDAVRALTGGE